MAAMMIFAGCGKEDVPTNPEPNTPEPNDTIVPELTQNELIIGTDHYLMESTLSITNEGVYLFGVTDPNGIFDIIVDVPSSMLQQTVNLAQPSSSDHFFINFYSTDLSFCYQRGDDPINTINDEEVNSVFTEGTMLISNQDGVAICKVSGTLSNGTYVGFMMNVDVTDIQAMDSQIVYDGQPYPAGVSANYYSSYGTYTFMIFGESNGDAGIDIGVDLKGSDIGKTISLTSPNAPCFYNVNVFMLDLGITATQSASNTGVITSSYWNIAEQTNYPQEGNIFTRGTLSTEEDEYAISMTLTGTLTNGHSVSAQMRIDKSEIVQR